MSLIFMTMMAAQPASARGVDWSGTWATDFGPVVLRQDGARVWGDYTAAQGMIEARVQPDGVLRGSFLRGDRRWGFFEWRRSGPGWRGVYAMNDLPRLDGTDQAWNAQSRTGGDVTLRFATGTRMFWPPTFPEGPSGIYAAFVEPPRLRPAPPAAARPGPWHVTAEFNSPGRPSAAERFGIWIALSHPPGLDRGRVHLTFVTPERAGLAACPAQMHPALCRDMLATFPVFSNTQMDRVQVLGLRLAPDQATLLFRLGSTPAVRLMTLRRTAGANRALLRVGSIEHGIELLAEVTLGDAGCPFDECLKDFDLAPRLGLKSGVSEAAFAILPDDRAAAHAALRPAPPPAPPPTPSRPPAQPPSEPLARSVPLAYSGPLTIRALNGEALGSVELATARSGRVMGSGEVLSPRPGAGMVPVTAQVKHLAPQAMEVALSFPVASGLPQAFLLLDRAPAEPEGALQGTLITGSSDRQNWVQVTLYPESPDDPDSFDDAPGFGVHASRFGLRNTAGAPAGLRDRPRSDAPMPQAIVAGAADIQVIECTPAIDGLAWEELAHPARLGLLDTRWCNVFRESAPQITGWIPGHFLTPLGN
ncbi:MAG: hypothetical protein ACK4GO_18020 [Gemmobacter sp.]